MDDGWIHWTGTMNSVGRLCCHGIVPSIFESAGQVNPEGTDRNDHGSSAVRNTRIPATL